MQIDIQGIHLQPFGETRTRIEKKLRKLTTPYPFIHHGKVLLKKQTNEPDAPFEVEVLLHLTKAELFASARDADIFTAFDKVQDKLKRQIEKYKEKVYSNP